MSTALCTGVSRHQAGEEVMVALTAFRLDSGADIWLNMPLLLLNNWGLRL
jgi:hypothetical protein